MLADNMQKVLRRENDTEYVYIEVNFLVANCNKCTYS